MARSYRAIQIHHLHDRLCKIKIKKDHKNVLDTIAKIMTWKKPQHESFAVAAVIAGIDVKPKIRNCRKIYFKLLFSLRLLKQLHINWNLTERGTAFLSAQFNHSFRQTARNISTYISIPWRNHAIKLICFTQNISRGQKKGNENIFNCKRDCIYRFKHNLNAKHMEQVKKNVSISFSHSPYRIIVGAYFYFIVSDPYFKFKKEKKNFHQESARKRVFRKWRCFFFLNNIQNMLLHVPVLNFMPRESCGLDFFSVSLHKSDAY